MTEETQQTEMVETEQPTQTNTEMVQISAAELEQIRTALKKANGEAAKYRKTAEQVEVDRKAKEEAEMTALDKAEKRAAAAETELKRERHTRLQETAAKNAGLSPKLADRLKGDTLEEMEADAKAIIEDLPKPAPKGPGSPPPPKGRSNQTPQAGVKPIIRL